MVEDWRCVGEREGEAFTCHRRTWVGGGVGSDRGCRGAVIDWLTARKPCTKLKRRMETRRQGVQAKNDFLLFRLRSSSWVALESQRIPSPLFFILGKAPSVATAQRSKLCVCALLLPWVRGCPLPQKNGKELLMICGEGGRQQTLDRHASSPHD